MKFNMKLILSALLFPLILQHSSLIYGLKNDTSGLFQFVVDNVQRPHRCPEFQESFSKWLLRCSAPEERSGELLERVVIFYQLNPAYETDCRMSDQCGQLTMDQGSISTLDFQYRYLDPLVKLLQQEGCKQFFNVTDLAKGAGVESGLTPDQIRQILTLTGIRLLAGDCIRASSPVGDTFINEYLDAIFERYSNGMPNVPIEGIQQLLKDVQLETSEEGVTSMQEQGVFHSRRHHRRSRSKVGVSREESSRQLWLVQKLASIVGGSNAVSWSKLTLSGNSFGNASDLNQCLTSDQVLAYFDVDTTSALSKDEFLQMGAYIVYQISSGNPCQKPVDDGDKDATSAQAYGYGTLCVFVVSACSALGYLIIPALPASIYEIMMAAFLALAFGTLTGDAILHMLPEALFPDEDSGDKLAPPSFFKCLVLVFSIYGLFVFEALTHLIVHNTPHEHGDDGDAHGHSHAVPHDVVKNMKQLTRNDSGRSSLSNEVVEVAMAPVDNGQPADDLKEKSRTIKDMVRSEDQTPVCLGLTTLALVIMVGDAIHNVTDGIAIGAGFAISLSEGFSTALAVFFHELPHEFGDFVILLMTGLSLKRALVFNFLASLTSFIGLYIGIALGENEEANQWIFSVTTGMFLYVAVADMLPELRNMKVKNRWQVFIAQNIGALVGICFMVLMYFLEDLISF